MSEWYKERYNWDFDKEEYKRGYLTVTNDHCRIDIHPSINGSGKMGSTPLREPGPEYWIVTPEEAEEYADKICNALNKAGVSLD